MAIRVEYIGNTLSPNVWLKKFMGAVIIHLKALSGFWGDFILQTTGHNYFVLTRTGLDRKM